MTSLSGFGQEVFPVQVFTVLYPPYSPDVSCLYSSAKERMSVTMINTDMSCPVLRVRLRMKISGTVFSLVTPPEIYTPEIELPAGMPVRLSMSDLSVFFEKGNVRPSGNPSEYYRTNRLPDGFYRFHFEAFDAQANRLVSNINTGFAQAWIAAASPPVLNLPLKGESVAETAIPAIFFSWMPMHNNSLYAAYQTIYEFSLSEIYDKTLNPEAAFLYSPVLYTEQTNQTFFMHSAAQPALIPGRRYAWRVRAVAVDGTEKNNVFVNDGYSEVFWFDYVADCHPVNQTAALFENGTIRLTWTGTAASEYRLEYRKRGAEAWESENVYGESHVISRLESGVAYEYRIASRCDANDVFVYSPVSAFEVPGKSEPGVNCGLLPDLLTDNRKILKKLSEGDVVYAGDFPVKITKVSGSGSFTGEGLVLIPVLKGVIASVTFSGITVNTDRRLLSGYFETQYDKSGTNSKVWNVDQTFDGGSGVGDIRTGEEKASYVLKYEIDANQPVTVVSKVREETADPGESDSYELSKGENQYYVLTFTDTNGKKHALEMHEIPATISDQSGNSYRVDPEGHLTAIYEQGTFHLDPETRNIYRDDIATITFEKTDDTKYALDAYREVYEKETLFFEEYKTTEETIISSAKFLMPGETDEIFVRLLSSFEGFDPEKVRFITGKDKELAAINYDKDRQGWTISLMGSDAGDGQELFVVYEETKKKLATLGKLRIFSYNPRSIKIRLVPVNGFRLDTDEITTTLHKIYRPVGIHCEVKIEENFENREWDQDGNGMLQVTGSGIFSTLTPEMKKLQSEYSDFKKENIEKDALYLFMMEGCDSLDVVGDMPRGKQFGYLFPGAGGQTAAHEIAHGIFKLRHIDDYHFSKSDLADNLMNSPGGMELAKYQWDAIHAPGIVIGLFEKDEDGMSIITDNKLLCNFLEQLRLSLQDGKSFKITAGMNTSEKGGVILNRIKYASLSVTYNKNTSLSLKDAEANLFSEKNIYGKEVFCIGYANNAIKIVLPSEADRTNLLKYLQEKRANAFLLFVSGYDPMDEVVDFLNYNAGQNEYKGILDKIIGFVNKTPLDTDRKDYWNQNQFSDQMIARLRPKKVTYMAGHDNIGTSNHRTMVAFINSYSLYEKRLVSKGADPSNPENVIEIMQFNTEPNVPGFLQRRHNGQERGWEYVEELMNACSKDKNGKVTDTLDIVCHSMGFAHALGILDVVKKAMKTNLKGLTLGRFYIFAPENACSGEVDLKEWQEIWQYGSNEDKMKKEPRKQDGVAPQCAVEGIDYKRAFIPENEPTQSFVGSHSIKNYGWVFGVKKGNEGYITPR